MEGPYISTTEVKLQVNNRFLAACRMQDIV